MIQGRRCRLGPGHMQREQRVDVRDMRADRLHLVLPRAGWKREELRVTSSFWTRIGSTAASQHQKGKGG